MDRALVVDDSLTVRMDLKDAFEAAGFEVSACATAADARAALAGDPFSVVVLDVVLPDGDGVEFLAEIRGAASTAEVPVIVLSAETEVRDRIRGLQTGADEYVGKPYDATYVIARARELIRRRSPAPAAAPRVTILVIDDSPTFRDALRTALVESGYDVLTTESGEEGLRVAADRRPTAIVVDGVLPGIEGTTVIRRVRLDSALRSVPCILLTGSEGPGAELRALEAGADAFVRKDAEMSVVLAKIAAVVRQSSSARAEEGASLLGPKRILAVDDSVTYLNELADTLRQEGYDVSLARSGEEALDLLAVQSVDCILLDLVMPGLSGQDTCRRIKAAPVVRDIPLVVLTSREDRSAMLESLVAGADDFIQKSGDFDVLKARVRAQIRRKHFEDDHRQVREELLRRELEATEARAARDLAETRAALVEELERKNRELEAFSYSVSHDLRAPLRSIEGFSRALLEDHGGSLDDEGKACVARVCSAARRMTECIDGLLDLSRVGRAELQRTSVDLSGMARKILADLALKEPARVVTVAVDERLVVRADARLMHAVLENLLGNAWKFTAKTAGARIALGAEDKPAGRVYAVRDNGAGFDMAYAAKLFGPFQRLHAQNDFPGTGIGLATVQRIIDRHGGRVWAEGTPGKGAAISFTLPDG